MNAVTENFPLVFTDSAVAKVRDLIYDEGNPELKLRVFVTGGGCSGFQYGFTFDEIDFRSWFFSTNSHLLCDSQNFRFWNCWRLGATADEASYF